MSDDTTPEPAEGPARLASDLARQARQADRRRALVFTCTAEWEGWCARRISDTVGVETPREAIATGRLAGNRAQSEPEGGHCRIDVATAGGGKGQ